MFSYKPITLLLTADSVMLNWKYKNYGRYWYGKNSYPILIYGSGIFAITFWYRWAKYQYSLALCHPQDLLLMLSVTVLKPVKAHSKIRISNEVH